jgi:hypothetical protein
MTQGGIVGIAVALALVAGPLLLGLTGWIRARRASADALPNSATLLSWKLTIVSGLLYVLSFNLAFFIQELFLVLPKALTPGLHPTLFHNNHRWEGEHPLASLFQGTGALAIFVSGLLCTLILRRSHARSATVRLFLIWMAYHGFFQALPQVVIGSINPRNDVGMAMDYLRLDATVRTAAALGALTAIPPIALWLTRAVLSLADDTVQIASARARTRFIFDIATLPALIAIPLIIPFRIPRELIEVVMPPVVVTLVGIAWMQAGAWRVTGVKAGGSSGVSSVAFPLGAVLILLVVFQAVLRPGVPFFR